MKKNILCIVLIGFSFNAFSMQLNSSLTNLQVQLETLKKQLEQLPLQKKDTSQTTSLQTPLMSITQGPYSINEAKNKELREAIHILRQDPQISDNLGKLIDDFEYIVKMINEIYLHMNGLLAVTQKADTTREADRGAIIKGFNSFRRLLLKKDSQLGHSLFFIALAKKVNDTIKGLTDYDKNNDQMKKMVKSMSQLLTTLCADIFKLDKLLSNLNTFEVEGMIQGKLEEMTMFQAWRQAILWPLIAQLQPKREADLIGDKLLWGNGPEIAGFNVVVLSNFADDLGININELGMVNLGADNFIPYYLYTK